MVGLYDSEGKFNHHNLTKGLKSKRLGGGDAVVTIDGVDGPIELDSWISTFLGALDGFTYSEVQGDASTVSNCFFSGYAMVENIDNVIYILDHAGDDAGSYKWFQYVFDEPINLALNTTVLYQMCNFPEYLVMIKNWTDLDYSSFAYDGVSMIVNGIMDIPQVINEYKTLECEGTCSCPDEETGEITFVAEEDCNQTINRYEQGKITGKAVVRFFGTFVPPVVA